MGISMNGLVSPTNVSLPENQSQVNPSVDLPGELPSLVYIDQTNASVTHCEAVSPVNQAKLPLTAKPSWCPKQRRTFQRIKTFLQMSVALGWQVIRTDLTSPVGSDARTLLRDFQELKRRVERRFRVHLYYYNIRTTEGNGVLHQVWGVDSGRPVYFPQAWLSEEWEKIRGAKIVYIKRMKSGKHHQARVARYCASQYLGGQTSIAHCSYSRDLPLKLGEAWNFFKKEFRRGFAASSWCGLSPFVGVVTYVDMLRCWGELLDKGWCKISNAYFFISNRLVDVAYSGL